VPKICDALQYAHEEGVLHRDIKPENILLDAKGRVKLADFGIAKIIAQADPAITGAEPRDDLTMTLAGATLGTPQYMAPEQREAPATVDHRADIYSLGVVFYELLTGELPVGEFTRPSSLSAAEPRVDAIVEQALERIRDRRQSSAGELKTQVEAATAPLAREAAAEEIPLHSRRDLQRFSRGWWRHIVKMTAALLLFCFAVPFLLHRLLPPVYYAKAIIQPDSRPARGESLSSLNDREEILRSEAVLEHAIRDLKRRWGHNFPAARGRMLGELRSALQLRVVHGSIEIGVWWHDRHEVAIVANAIAIAYRDERLKAMKEDFERRLPSLRRELEKQEKRVEEAAAEVAEIRTRDGIDDPNPANMGAMVAARDQSTDLKPYIEAKWQNFSARRMLEAVKAAVLNDGFDAEPAKIWELADAPRDPVHLSFRRFKYALTRLVW
jgi:hypothetical protein